MIHQNRWVGLELDCSYEMILGVIAITYMKLIDSPIHQHN